MPLHCIKSVNTPKVEVFLGMKCPKTFRSPAAHSLGLTSFLHPIPPHHFIPLHNAHAPQHHLTVTLSFVPAVPCGASSVCCASKNWPAKLAPHPIRFAHSFAPPHHFIILHRRCIVQVQKCGEEKDELPAKLAKVVHLISPKGVVVMPILPHPTSLHLRCTSLSLHPRTFGMHLL